jgi:hypothetical protein
MAFATKQSPRPLSGKPRPTTRPLSSTSGP